jgi:ABC-2 type transport system ATP-binding protein
MKQLAKLAQAIAHGPKLLFLDEPTNGLDPAARVRMIRLIREVRDTKQVHLIISSHLLRDVEECCEEVVILKDGRLVASCNLEEERRANLNFIEMEVLEGSGGFQEGIDRLGCDYAALGHGRYKMVLREGIAVKDLYRIAAERDAQIRKLNHRQDSLEDIFLKAMEN